MNHNFVSEPANFSASDRLGKNFPAAQKKKPLIDEIGLKMKKYN